MRKQLLRVIAACLLSTVLLYSGGIKMQPTTAAATNMEKANQSVQQLAERWVKELAAEPQFVKWKQAKLSITPLGPGTHSWLVLVNQKEQIVGYMVINALDQGGYQLGEYGIGSDSPFKTQTMQRSIKQLELLQPANQIEAIYINPLLAAWKVTTNQEIYFTDAITGEQLPDEAKGSIDASKMPLSTNTLKQFPAKSKLSKNVTLASFDPYGKMPWLTKEPLQINAKTNSSLLIKMNSKEQLRYTAELFDGQMLYVWSVAGYHKWDNGFIYIALENNEDGSDRRYLPINLLVDNGEFYR